MRDDGAGERDGLGPQALGETLVQDTLVSPVLVEDYQLLSLLSRRDLQPNTLYVVT